MYITFQVSELSGLDLIQPSWFPGTLGFQCKNWGSPEEISHDWSPELTTLFDKWGKFGSRSRCELIISLQVWSVVYGPASPSPVRDIRSQTRWISLQFNKSPGWISHTLWFEVFQIRAKPELGLAEDSDLLCTWVKQTWWWPTYAVVIWPWHTHLIFPSCLPRFPKIKAI